ncbi:MFS transporter [Amycolatopsis nigrescens]|uniref:MFS transporter n=1 Tax=Amycolatopsis nigrescens TaxID=381445 RepID=UPI0003A7BB05|nr:MFS transporter [Amycolatopsis nigrescens]
MPGPLPVPPSREVRDFYGRRYQVGASDRDLLGRSRKWMLWAAWAAMLAAGVGQYGYAALMPVVVSTHGWTTAQGFAVLAVWFLCQSTTVYPAAALRLPPVAAISAGALLSAAGLVTLGVAGSFPVVLAGHALLGGMGAGLIYGAALGAVAKWYPERSGRTALVSGAFGYGVLPLLLLSGWLAGPADTATVFTATGAVVLLVAGASALILRDPPPNWWPAHLDPRLWAVDKSVNPALRNNRPAIRHYSAGELVRSPVFVLLYLAVVFAAAVALFDLGYLALFTMESGWASGFGAAAVGVLAGVSGAARSAAGWAADRFGRARVLRVALCTGGLAQLLLLGAGANRLPALLLVGAGLAGAATGICYALLPGLVAGHFGDRPGLPNFGLFYGAKAAGGLLGAGMVAFFAVPAPDSAGFPVAAVLCFVSAGLVGLLWQPGRPSLRLRT